MVAWHDAPYPGGDPGQGRVRRSTRTRPLRHIPRVSCSNFARASDPTWQRTDRFASERGRSGSAAAAADLVPGRGDGEGWQRGRMAGPEVTAYANQIRGALDVPGADPQLVADLTTLVAAAQALDTALAGNPPGVAAATTA